MYNMTTRVRETVIAVETQQILLYIFCVCVSLVIQHAKCISRIILLRNLSIPFHIIS